VDTGWHHDGTHRVGIPFRFLGAEPQTPRVYRCPHALGQNLMPVEHGVEALLEQHVEGFSQPIEHWQRRRIGEIPRRVCFYVVAEIKEHPSAAGALLRRQRPGTGTDDAETSGKQESFLRSSDSEIQPTRERVMAGQPQTAPLLELM